MLFVLGGVAGDGLVAQLREFDADFLGGNAVEPIAHDGPIGAAQGVAAHDVGDAIVQVEHFGHGRWQVAQRGQQLLPTLLTTGVGWLPSVGGVGQSHGQQHAGGHLGIERLGGSHAHLHISPVGGVEHPVGFVA